MTRNRSEFFPIEFGCCASANISGYVSIAIRRLFSPGLLDQRSTPIAARQIRPRHASCLPGWHFKTARLSADPGGWSGRPRTSFGYLCARPNDRRVGERIEACVESPNEEDRWPFE